MIVICGEALFDVFATHRTANGFTLDAHRGGSPLNVAIGLARLGQAAGFLGSCSTDPFGDNIVEALRAEGVDVSLVQRNASPTTLSVVGVDAHGVPAYTFYGSEGADRQLGSIEPLDAQVTALHLGSYATVVAPIAQRLRDLVERERGRRVVSLDPNVRTSIEPDLDVWRDTLHWMLPRCDVVKISAEDLGQLYPGWDAAEFGQHALEMGVALTIVTDGARGASGFTRTANAHVAAPRVALIDTVGAGDTFQAALLCWLAEQHRLQRPALEALQVHDLTDLLTFAVNAAAITCSRRGADLPRRQELLATTR